jgi:D-alanine-D-alanine ligase
VGAGTLGSAVGMDKDVMKRLLAQAGLPLLPHAVLRKGDYRQDAPTALRQVASLRYPLFVKPACMGSSVGVSRVREPAELAAAIEEAFNYDDKLVIEQGLDQPREIECAVLGSQSPLVSVPGEIVVQHPDGFYSYAAKYLDDGAITRIPADLSPDETQRVQDLTRRTFQVLECSGMARVDMFLSKERQLFVNEINTIPGCTAISMYPKMMAASGVSGADLVGRLIDDALTRGQARRQLSTSR